MDTNIAHGIVNHRDHDAHLLLVVATMPEDDVYTYARDVTKACT